MSTLHTVNKSPFATQALISCLNHAKAGDAILMIEDGVYGGLGGTGLTEIIAEFGKNVSLYVLSPDLAARGVDAGRLIGGIEGVDYSGFVDLVAKHDRTQAWL
ncbi:sulfurtransferase complex subunit TusB [Maritimibacter fusiformis]|jgi:tRNA 2-thiouridine synthesizing protein B|uniref:Sulfurtransferase complex subunit TusB n=1 Tax=Maritimibacter fusiformis TaxID=2603819 RepID=A0A5D0R986_9RHOB|nr:sulfurtransferase complex subunit TusB [Maritimibacter fusiformis]TYB77669.1 sulfurtransferase complex subunit TusB [Maritimibacter fusiformis]